MWRRHMHFCFFSSRRRHTRYWRDWSSDVCSSDLAGPLAFVALIAGWITTEVGRQPWIVYEVMRTEEAVTQADGLEVGYIALVGVYLGVAAAVFWLLRRLARKPPESEVAGG